MKRRTTLLILILAITSAGAQDLPSVSSLSPWSAKNSVTTNIKNIRELAGWLDTPLQYVPLGSAESLSLTPGRYKFDLASYCLHAGTYGPTEGDGYVAAKLEGSRVPIIKNILVRSVNHPEVPQQDIQRLIWGIEAGANFRDYDAGFQTRVMPVLDPGEVALLSVVDQSTINAVVDRFLPASVKALAARYEQMRGMVTDAQQSYEELERVAVLTGVAPIGKGSRNISAGQWASASDGFYIRYFPSGYSTTTAEIIRTAPHILQRDDSGRIFAVESGLYRMEIEYTSAQTASQSRKKNAHSISDIKSLRFLGPAQDDDNSIEGAGYVVASGAVTYGKKIRGLNKIPDDLPTGYADRVLFTEAQWKSLESYVRGRKNDDNWRKTDSATNKKLRADFTDLTHLYAALSALDPADNDWLKAHKERMALMWSHSACMLAGDCSVISGQSQDPQLAIGSPKPLNSVLLAQNDSRRDPVTDGQILHPETDLKSPFTERSDGFTRPLLLAQNDDARNRIPPVNLRTEGVTAVPSNTSKQRLAQSNRIKRRY